MDYIRRGGESVNPANILYVYQNRGGASFPCRSKGSQMNVKPLESYQLLGTSIKLDKEEVYEAIPATNTPDHEARGAVYVGEVLLVRGEYVIMD
jgi:hypothetical protein